MADIPPATTALDPTFQSSDKPYTPLPLKPNSFTGMVNNSPAAVESRYTSAISSYGRANGPSSSHLYQSRLQANLSTAEYPKSGYNAWNRRRQEAIERGEDPNSEWLARTEERLPDSHLERAWRKLMGKGRTKKEERERKEKREAGKREEDEESQTQIHTTTDYGKKQDDGIMR